MFDLYISFHILLARSCTCYQLDIFLFEIKYIFILRKDLTAFIINYMIFELSFPKSLNNETLHCNIFFTQDSKFLSSYISPLSWKSCSSLDGKRNENRNRLKTGPTFQIFCHKVLRIQINFLVNP